MIIKRSINYIMNNNCSIKNLKCNGIKNPVGIDSKVPEFSWLFVKPGRSKFQKAYRIIVSDSRDLLIQETGNMWDSGMVTSGVTHIIAYEGKPVGSRTRYFWKVFIWDEEGQISKSTEDAYFETAFLKKSEWKASWIGGANLLRNEFAVDREFLQARAYITGLGYYELRINGDKIGDQVLSPSYTDYKKRIEYQVYDITENLHHGVNALGIMLGAHCRPIDLRRGIYYNGKLKALLQVEITFADGTCTVIKSDGTWRCADGPIVENSIYDGEVYDALLERDGWDQLMYSDSDWDMAKVYDWTDAELKVQSLPPIRVIEDISPESVICIKPGVYVADFGQNIAGWTRIEMDGSGKRGIKVTLRHAELLNENGTINNANLRTAKATDSYTLKGNLIEVYEPRFTYHGFRYVQIEGYTGELTAENITARVVHSDVEEISSFECSNLLFNRIHSAMKWTLKNNLHSIPTDCPQRDERQGWLGDGHIASEAAICNFDMQHFYRNWLEDIRNTQEETGNIIDLAAPGWKKKQSLAWNCAYYVIVWNLYKHYGDISVVKDHYSNLNGFFG
jgi:alpha-L-rhamnosidase